MKVNSNHFELTADTDAGLRAALSLVCFTFLLFIVSFYTNCVGGDSGLDGRLNGEVNNPLLAAVM